MSSPNPQEKVERNRFWHLRVPRFFVPLIHGAFGSVGSEFPALPSGKMHVHKWGGTVVAARPRHQEVES